MRRRTAACDLGFGHSIPLGAPRPAQADFSTSGLGDPGAAAPADHMVFVPINGDKPSGSTAADRAAD